MTSTSASSQDNLLLIRCYKS